MTGRRQAFALALAGVVAAALPAQALAQPRLPHTRRRLDNGLEVIEHVERRVPIVAVRLRYAVGSMHDPPTARGLAHTIEHLMFRGSAHVADGEHFLHLQRVGGVGTNATTEPEAMSFLTTVPRASLATALWLESDRMGFFAPSPATLRAEVETVGNEWHDRVGAEPRATLFEQLWNAMFPADHAYHHQSATSARAITPEAVERFAKAHLGPANALLVLAGDLPADVDAMVDRWFGDLHGGATPPTPDVSRTLDAELRLRAATGLTRTPMLLVAWPTPALYAPGDAEADIVATVLEHGVFEQLAERAGHDPDEVVHFEARQSSMLGCSVFLLGATGLPAGDPARLLAIVDDVLRQLGREGPSPAAVARARKRIATGLLQGLQTVAGRAAMLAAYASAGRDPDGVADDLRRYDAVDPADAAAFVRTWLPLDRRVVLLNAGEGAR